MKVTPCKALRPPEQFKQRVVLWAEKIKVQPRQIRLQKMNRKWASCSPSGWVCFSTDLLLEKQDFQEYVIVHELLHLQIPNHGRLFKSLLTAYLPDWEKRKYRMERVRI